MNEELKVVWVYFSDNDIVLNIFSTKEKAEAEKRKWKAKNLLGYVEEWKIE